MNNISNYIIEKLHFSKGMKRDDYKDIPLEKRFLGKCLMIFSKLGEGNFNTKSYLELVDVKSFYIYKERSDDFKTEVKIVVDFLTDISKDVLNVKKERLSIMGYIDNVHDATIYVSLFGCIMHLINNVDTDYYLDKFSKDKYYDYKEFTPNANVNNSICKFDISNEDFDTLKLELDKN